MTFARKIFIAVFLSTLMVGTILTWASYKYSIDRSEADFASRYKIFTKVLGDTLSRLDSNTETMMLNAAKVVVEKDSEHGVLSTDELRKLQGELGITHIFLANNHGTFIRSTNDDPAGIPNLFSFCGDYRKLVAGGMDVEATPIIKPNPEPKPFKFLSVPNRDRSRIVEIGVRVDFIAKTLAEASESDRNVTSMSLYAPDGTPFGTYSDENVVFESQKTRLPDSFESPLAAHDFVSFFTKVASSHPKCCECDISGTSKNGEYYYVLESRVSKAELKKLQAHAGLIFLLIGIGNGIFSFILARFLSRRLVKNIELAVERVRKIKEKGDLSSRIGMKAGDEISFLTEEFDRLLESHEISQKKLIKAEKVQSKVELAKIVAHNIRSPILAIEMMLPGLVTVPERMRRVLKNAVTEIKELSEKLKTQSDSMDDDLNLELDTDLVFLPIFLDDLVRQKNIEFSSKAKASIIFSSTETSDGLFIKASSVELRSVLSNIINNAIEAYGVDGGKVEVTLGSSDRICLIKIADNGVGIPQEYLAELGRKNISLKGSGGRGLGLTHAFSKVESWGGSISIGSELGFGTSIKIQLYHYHPERSEGIGSHFTV